MSSARFAWAALHCLHGSAMHVDFGQYQKPVPLHNMLSLFSRLPKKLTKHLVQGAALMRNPYTLGVRLIVLNDHGHVLLVRHSYLPGWYLPGGGVDGGEPMVESARRELLEEAGIRALEVPRLLGMFLNSEAWGRDHVGLFEISRWEPADRFLMPSAEIVEAMFFDPAHLPDTVSGATERRLTEYFQTGLSAGGRW